MNRLAGIALAALAALAGTAAPALSQVSIALRPTARVEAGEPVRLGQIAMLEGPGAEALADVEVFPGAAPARGATITAEELRPVLKAAGVSWGSTTLSGGSCSLLVAPRVEEPRPPAERAPAEPGVGTIGAALTARIAVLVDAAPADVRLEFSDHDADLLDTPVSGCTLEVRAVGESDRMALAVTLYDGDRVVVGKTIRVGVRVRREVVLSAGPKRRGEVLGEGDITAEYQWLSPSDSPAPRGRVLGAAVRNRLSPGEVVTEQHLAPPVVVRKGDQVMVRCIAGSVVVSMRARALGEARDGDIVQLESLDREGTTFEARMAGRGRAVLLSAQPARAGKERNP